MPFCRNIHLLLLLTAILLSGTVLKTVAQSSDLDDVCQIAGRGKLKGILSFRFTKFLSTRTSVRLFLAAWYEPDNSGAHSGAQGQLVIYEKNGSRYIELFHLDGKADLKFQDFGPLDSLTVPGLVVNFFSDVSSGGPRMVIALVQDKFQTVYQGEASEIVDLDGNGIPEIFESMWPDGDGYPRRTLIHVWDGTKYRKLISAKWEYRFSRAVLNRLKRYDRIRKQQDIRKAIP